METKSSNKQMVFVVVCSLIILISIAFYGTYAYFTATVKTTGDAENATTDVQTSTIQDVTITGTPTVAVDNMIPGDSYTTTFQVNNPNDFPVDIALYWDNVTNTFVNQADLILTLTSSVSDVETTFIDAEQNLAFPSENLSDLVSSLTLKAQETQTFTLTVLYKDTDQNQISDMSRTFSGTIKVKGL